MNTERIQENDRQDCPASGLDGEDGIHTVPGTPLQSSQPESNAPRLAIQRLKLENFKSYGGVVEVGPFHKSFSSIVGPNGSGKSNVIDAMLFVFGRRAKQLRHSKLSELLHHSATYPNVQSATVTVFFHDIIDTGGGDDDYEVVDGSCFAVARRAFRNNTSKYYLDDREVKMTAVVDLLKSKGVDLDNNRFLILQGEVEQIAMMKPKAQTAHEDGLLEYLEDIIGSNKYIERIDETANKVESLNEERAHKMNRVKAAERERDALDDAKAAAENYLDKERDLLHKKIRLSKAERFEVCSSLKHSRERYAEAKANVDEFRCSVKEKEETLQVLEKNFNETQKKLELAVKAMNEAKESYSAFERKDIKLREDIKALKLHEKKLSGVIRQEKKRFEEHTGKHRQNLDEKEEGEEKLAPLEHELQNAQDKLEKIRDKVKAKTAPIREKLEQKQAALLPFSETVNQCRQELQISQNELKLITEKLDAPKKQLEQAETSLKDMEDNYDVRKQGLSKMESEVKASDSHVNELNKNLEQLQQRARGLSEKSSTMRRKVEEARSANEFATTRSRLHSAIFAAARSGELQGVVGRLGDLASVDSQYAVAVGAAAGASLDNIVVYTAEQSQACIQFLRRENLGRATFVILEKVEYLKNSIESWASSGRQADGPRLFDYLRIPNPQNRTAIYYALRDTLVANTLEEARRMAFKPTRMNRVVTLAGELIESSGAMTGGGRGPSRYRLGTGRGVEDEMSPENLHRLEEQLESFQMNIRATQEDVQRLTSEKQEAVAGREQLQMSVTRAGLEVKSLHERIVYMNNDTIPSLRRAVEDLRKGNRGKLRAEFERKKQLETTIAKQEDQFNTARASCDGLEKDIAKLQDKIVAAGGQEMKNGKEAVEKRRSELSELQSAVSKAASRASASQKAASAAAEAVKRAEAEMETVRSGIATARNEMNSMTDEAELVFQKYKESEAVHEEWVEKLGMAQDDHEAIKSDLKKLRRKEVSLNETACEFQRKVHRDEHDLNGLRRKHKDMEKKLGRLSLMAVDVPTAESQNEDEADADSEAGEMDVNASSGNEVDEAQDTDLAAEFQMSSREKNQLITEISVIDGELSNMDPNIEAIAEYKTKDSEYKSQVSELDALTSRRDETKRECDSLRRSRLDEFMTGFSVITLKLKELYQMITLGGDAELELVDSLDPFSEGIVFSVRPPKKSWKNISNLSGGEKTLSSLALVFALHHYKPTPLYFLDEIDAALDYKNVSIVANYVKDRTKNAQFIIISLRNNMFELADRLVGIYKTHNTTKSVTIDPAAFTVPIEPRAQSLTS